MNLQPTPTSNFLISQTVNHIPHFGSIVPFTFSSIHIRQRDINSRLLRLQIQHLAGSHSRLPVCFTRSKKRCPNRFVRRRWHTAYYIIRFLKPSTTRKQINYASIYFLARPHFVRCGHQFKVSQPLVNKSSMTTSSKNRDEHNHIRFYTRLYHLIQ
ncbi:hypothetical protein HanIR_Chr01g0032471 [Helianthus annuus]|nr:hypothetical protein HanIR_Chr01g0032471 [Helianthus annuus]